MRIMRTETRAHTYIEFVRFHVARDVQLLSNLTQVGLVGAQPRHLQVVVQHLRLRVIRAHEKHFKSRTQRI